MSDAETYGLCVVCGAPRTVASRIVGDTTVFMMVCSADPSHDIDASDRPSEEEE